MKCILRILMVERSDDVERLKNVLLNDGYDLAMQCVDTAEGMEELLVTRCWDLVFFSDNISDFTIESGLKICRQADPDLPFIVLSSMCDEDRIVYAMQLGVDDYLIRNNLSRLLSVVRRESESYQAKLRRRSEELLLLKNEERYRNIAESITDVLIVLDSNLRCTYWNQAAEKLTGVSTKSALSRPFYELFPENPGLEILDMLQGIIEQPRTTVTTFVMTKDNKDSHYEICIYPGNQSLVVLIREIAQYRFTQDLIHPEGETENQLTQSQKLRILGLLTSGVAHEVRNPLNAISVVLEALFQELGDNPDYLLYKDHVFTHVERLTRLMQDLLELGKPIERSKVVIIDFLELVRESIALWKSSGNHTGHSVSVDLNFDEELKIKGDPLKLQQVFMNVLENACQHSPKGSEITIFITKESRHLQVKVCDQGCGIKEEYLKRMFEPFFTTRKKGTGLGLAIVKHIVEVHGGTIFIRNSDPGPGCTVEIELPIYARKQVKAITPSLQATVI